jgi:predicted secreted protein
MMWRFIVRLLACVMLAQSAAAADGDAPPVPMVTVTASATATVPNDRLHAWLRAEAEHASPATAANDVNARVARALARLKKVAGVTVQTSGYTTQQVGEKGRPARWRVAQGIALEGADFAALATLLTELQDADGLLLSGLSFAVSEAKRRETEDALTQQALASWRTRAQNAARGLGYGEWRPGRVSVGGSDVGRPQPMYRTSATAVMSAAAPVPLEAGTTEVTVNVTGEAVLN